MKDEFIAAVAIDVSVYAGYQTLTSCFLVSGSAIDLTGKKQIFYQFCFQGMLQLCWIKKVVFDGVSRTVKLCFFQAFYTLNGVNLSLQGQGRGKSVYVIFP